jgi:hypothetical protein
MDAAITKLLDAGVDPENPGAHRARAPLPARLLAARRQLTPPAAGFDDDGAFAGAASGDEEEAEGSSGGESPEGSDAEGGGDSEGGSEGEEGDEGADDADADLDDAALDDAAGLLAGAGDSSDEEAEVGSSGDEAGGAGARPAAKSFQEGGKADAFARAFERVLGAPAAAAAGGDGPILAASKSIAMRRVEDAAEAKADREAKRARLEARRRGRVKPAPTGADAAADVRERDLRRTATRGVVRLFNAVTQAQRRLRAEEAATGSRGKAARAGKASFLAELRAAKGAAEAAASGAGGGAEAAPAPGWEVLQEGFTGVGSAGARMKDWARAAGAEAGPGDEAAASDGGEEEEEDDGEGW